MTTAIGVKSVDYINPVLAATRKVFETMLDCTPKRTGLTLKQDVGMPFDVSGVISVTGKVPGVIVLSFSKAVAIEVLRRIIGTNATEIDSDVCDAVGELTNMIGGAAKAQLSQLELSLGIPNMILGRNHSVRFPSEIQPVCVTFDSEIGPFIVEVGFGTLN